MKKLIISAALALSCIGAAIRIDAQVRASASFGSPVTNAMCYSSNDRYYYLPEQGVYYNASRRVYVYPENNNWFFSSTLPDRYNGYNWRRSHYVITRERAPFMHHEEYEGRYGRNYHGRHVEWRRERDRDEHHHDHR